MQQYYNKWNLSGLPTRPLYANCFVPTTFMLYVSPSPVSACVGRRQIRRDRSTHPPPIFCSRRPILWNFKTFPHQSSFPFHLTISSPFPFGYPFPPPLPFLDAILNTIYSDHHLNMSEPSVASVLVPFWSHAVSMFWRLGGVCGSWYRVFRTSVCYHCSEIESETVTLLEKWQWISHWLL